MKIVSILFVITSFAGIIFGQYRQKSILELQQQKRAEENRSHIESQNRKEAARKKQVASIEDEPSSNLEEQKQIKERLSFLEKRLWRLEYLCKQAKIDISSVDTDSFWPLDTMGEIKLGKIGFIRPPSKIEVIQIVDKMNMICVVVEQRFRAIQGERQPLSFRESRTATGTNSGPTVDYVSYDYKEIVWIKGIETTGNVDGKIIKLDLPLEVTSTTQYKTEIGSMSTVFVLEPAELPRVQYLKK